MFSSPSPSQILLTSLPTQALLFLTHIHILCIHTHIFFFKDRIFLAYIAQADLKVVMPLPLTCKC